MDAIEQSAGLPRLRARRRWGPWLRILILALPVILLAQYAIFGASGYMAYRRKSAAYKSEQAKLAALRAENNALTQAVTGLQNDRATIESIAHQRFHLIRPNEVVYTYRTIPAVPSALAANH